MPEESVTQKRKRCRNIIRILKKVFPDSACRLTHRSPFELLIKTILSAQCTDERVNLVGETLFEKYPAPESFAEADLPQLERAVYSTGFYKHKAKNIQACCRMLTGRLGGKVPSSMEELLQLPGVGRKTANVIRATCFGIPGIVVDTHVIRISRLLKLTGETDPDKIEADLTVLIPEDERIGWSHRLSDHGRKTCIARRPRCHECPVQQYCPSAKN